MPVAGQIVGGRFRLVRPLGEGGMASVWAAEHLTMGNIVALKIISPELLEHEVAIARFNREARAAAKLRSPYVVQIFDHDVDPQVGPYIAMELLEGESLADRLERERTLSPPELSRIIQQVGKGLMRAHAAGIVHRDLKPDNIFLAVDEDDGETAKVLDFGVAKADSPLSVKESKKTVAGTLLGTLNYMSPEQAQGREVDHLTDLWALGVIVFEALVGQRPFEEEAPGAIVMQICAHPMPVPSKWNPRVPAGFDEWFAQACNRDPLRRFQSALQLANSLADLCEAEELSDDDILSASLPERIPSATLGFTAPAPGLLPVFDSVEPGPVEPAPASSSPGRKRRVLQLVVDSVVPPPLIPEPQPEVIPSEIPVQVEELVEVIEETHSVCEYFLKQATTTVGPITLETMRAGYQAGHVVPDALVWTAGWPAWKRAAEVLAGFPERPRKRAMPNLSLVGPTGVVPPGAPIPPPFSQQGASAAAAPKSTVRASVGKARAQEHRYYVCEGDIIVGPVRASVLRRGIEQSKVPPTALLWREGWVEWVSLRETPAELEAWKSAPAGLLRNRPGLEALANRCDPPSTAPPAITPNKRGQSK